ncbi:aminopeptidase [Sporosarcina sp. Te-1]|uniref:aminopeptidase n=1 Tax=Sporosarcina sp. Te-1 TaxID=2818390 RepID=UPI001A9FB4F7|nr:aminopeptidase [Sporosarcina sp. Te-1]QTD40705.1 aminopeptidase [Sporosarcina sp. Te-1]
MKIENIIPDFIEKYEAEESFGLSELETYLQNHADLFELYFPDHCPRTEERLQLALQQYPSKLEDLKRFSADMPDILLRIEQAFDRTFNVELDLKFKLIVGTFGSNAFVTRTKKRTIYFAAEKLSPQKEHLEVIAAHEIGHVTHFALGTKNGLDWSSVDWTSGLTTLYTEGVATYLSMKIVPGLRESVYYSFDNEGDPWVSCLRENKTEIKRRFLQDAETGWDMPKEKEWFRLSGGSYFGLNRIGYLLGTAYVQDLVDRVGEDEALTYWVEHDVKRDILDWLGRE